METQIKNIIESVRAETSKRLIGQEHLVDDILMALIAGGHVILEGVPGLAKTLAIKTISEILDLDFKRIQFTPDLLPADVTGTVVYEQAKGSFSVRKGPVFANVVLADEVNRAPAKVQSAMLEAMEERQITIGEETFKLPQPFFVLATQNPVEQEGTYNLPEAELDRFIMKLVINYPSFEDEKNIVKTCGKASEIPVKKVLGSKELLAMREAVDKVNCDEKLIEYIVSILNVTRPNAAKAEKNSNGSNSSYFHTQAFAAEKKEDITRYIHFGASPRAGIAMLQCSKIHALFENRDYVLPEDIKAVALNVLRHRLVLSYEASADSITSDDIIKRILDSVPLP